MNPSDASVYTDTWSPGTWAAILGAIVVMVIALMGMFIYLVNRACQAETPVPGSAARSEQALATTAPPAVESGTAAPAVAHRRRWHLVGAGHSH